MRAGWIFVCLVAVLLSLSAGSASAQSRKLHGNEAESQAVREMRGRLRGALSNGNLAACQGEGVNLANYNQANGGLALIDDDLAAVEQRLRDVGKLFDEFRQIRDLSSQKAVGKANGLIRAIAAKLASDAVTEVTVTLVSAPLPGVGKVLTEMGKQANDFLGNFNDANQLVDRARALQSLDAMSRYAEEQLRSLRPAVKEAETTRGVLNECRKRYLAGVASVQGQGGSASSLDQLAAEQKEKLLYCACRCSTSCAASSGYSLTGFDASPSCRNPANGPCYCQGFGCGRDPLKAECVQACLSEVGAKADAAAVKGWTESHNRKAGVPSAAPASTASATSTAANLAQGKPAATSSRSQWSKQNDAQGAVDGIKNGGFGFHTDKQQNPWWQVDLGESRALSEVRLFNRLDCCSERSRTVQVMLSEDGQNWQTVYRHNGSIFGGADGKPLKVALNGAKGRYLRLQLNENNWFHLDEVEVSSLAAGASSSSASEDTANWSGVWTTGWGSMQLTQTGSQVRGSYKFKDGRLEGNVQGNVFKGRWTQSNGQGRFSFRLAQDGRSFEGNYGYGDSDRDGGSWNGSR